MDWDVTEVKVVGTMPCGCASVVEGAVKFLLGFFRGVFSQLQDQVQFQQVMLVDPCPTDLDISASTYQHGPMRTTVTLDEDIYAAAVSVSRLSGERLGKVLSRMARRGLEQKNAPRRKGQRRFPIFDISPGPQSFRLRASNESWITQASSDL
jgi:hypothetical protein